MLYCSAERTQIAVLLYSHVGETPWRIVQEQTQSDSVLDDLACMLGCTRSSLNGEPFGGLEGGGLCLRRAGRRGSIPGTSPTTEGWLWRGGALRCR